MRNRFDEQLSRLNDELTAMGALCEEAINCCVKYLIDNDSVMRERTMTADEQIDQKERDIEQLCMKLLLQQQPVATDLRVISSALKMISDLERIGDQAADIAEIAAYLQNSRLAEQTHIPDMAKATITMVAGSLKAFVQKDINIAENVIRHDDVVDSLFDRVKNELVQSVRKTEVDAEAFIDLLMIAKYLERIGDHAENVAGWVIYTIKGEHTDKKAGNKEPQK